MIKKLLVIIVSIIVLKVNIFSYEPSSQKTINQEETNSEIATLKELIDEALKNNPDIKSLTENWDASKLRIPQASAWEDPQLSFNIMDLPIKKFNFNIEPMTGKQLFLMQQIPFPGKTSLKEKVAKEEVGISAEMLYEKKNEIVKEVKNAYYDLYLVDESIEITEKNKGLLESFVKIVQSKYEVGKGIQQDVLKAQVELSRVIEKLITLRQNRMTLISRINTLLNRSPEAQIVKLAEIEKSQFNFKIDELEKIAFDSRPVLKIMENEIVKNEYLYKLAQKDYYPNFNISLGYTQRDIGMDFISAMFSVNIPLFINKKQGKKVEETAYTIASVREGYIGMKNEIKYKIRELVHRIDEYNELFELLNQGIIPQASQSLRSAIAGYQVASVDFLTLLNNQMTLFDYEIEYYRILTDYEKSLADLEFILGKQLF